MCGPRIVGLHCIHYIQRLACHLLRILSISKWRSCPYAIICVYVHIILLYRYMYEYLNSWLVRIFERVKYLQKNCVSSSAFESVTS